MNIPPDITDLIERLDRELEQTDKKFVMKELLDEQTLLELLKLAAYAEQKARELNEMGEQFSQKWLTRLEGRKKIIKQQ